MKKNKEKLIFCFFIQIFLSACANGGNMIHQGFSFDTRYDSPEPTFILDYEYGNGNQVGTHANKGSVLAGKKFSQGETFGYLPRADYLYVKWMIERTGEIYEDRVDLSHRLPEKIEDCNVHFVVREDKLYVYIISSEQRADDWPIGPIKSYANFKQYQIYPDIEK